MILGYNPPVGAKFFALILPYCYYLGFRRGPFGLLLSDWKVLPLHIKVDTDLGRYGLMLGEVLQFLRALAKLFGLRFEGIFTYSAADFLA